MSCIFCALVAGEIPATKVHETEHTLAFMDIQPVRPGQVLVIPKTHVDHFSDVPEAIARDVFAVAHKVARAARKALSPQRMGFIVHGYGVPHAHMIVLPQHDHNDIAFGNTARIKDGAVTFAMDHVPLLPHEELAPVAAQIIAHLE